MRAPLILLIAITALRAASPPWLDLVAPVITPAEKKEYLAMPPAARAGFEERFWENRAIEPEEYFRRLQYVDAAFGSSRAASGANTDQGRVYLSLGPPVKVTRLPSSRVFVPLEVWYYDTVPGLLNTELRLIFYQPQSVGLPRLYSPVVDTIRALLVPQAATANMFGPNDSATESDIRQILKVGPAEDEVVTAASGIATGIKYSGNDEILGQITSPELMLGKAQRTKVTSRLVVAHPPLDVLETRSPFGGTQVDLQLRISAQRELNIEVLEGAATVYANRLRLGFASPEPVEYTHRLDLLAGSYRVMFEADGRTYAYPLEVRENPGMSEILRVDAPQEPSRTRTPFVLDGRQLSIEPGGRFVAVAVPEPGRVTWTLRRGDRAYWHSVSTAGAVAVAELPADGLPPGEYQLEAVTANDARSANVLLSATTGAPKATSISFNANLAPAQRQAFLGHQWLLRGRPDEARKVLAASLTAGDTAAAEVELARADALSGELDPARDRIRRILASEPDNFEALSVYAYIEARLQDYGVAAELYRKALAVRESPELRMALAHLPAQ